MYDNFGEEFELAYQEVNSVKRARRIHEIVSFIDLQEINHEYLQLFPNQQAKITLNLVEYTTLKTMPNELFDVVSLSTCHLKSGANIGKNGQYGRVNYTLNNNS